MAIRYLHAARKDIKDALKWSAKNFGSTAVQRYKKLLGVAIAQVATNPELSHSYRDTGLQVGIRLYAVRRAEELHGTFLQCVLKEWFQILEALHSPSFFLRHRVFQLRLGRSP